MTPADGTVASRPFSGGLQSRLPGDTCTGQKVFHALILSACVGVLAASLVLRADAEGVSLLGYHWPFHCRLHEILGIRCALCGMSRSFCSVAHGDLAAGFGFHPLGPFAFVLVGLEIVYRVYALALHPGRIGMRPARVHAAALVCLCVAVLGHWLAYLGGLIV